MNNGNVTDFIEHTSNLANGFADSSLSDEDIVTYFEDHLDNDARFRSTIIYKVPGYDDQEKSLVLDKYDFIESIQSGADTINRYENVITVEDIEIGDNKKSAFVKTSGYEFGEMPVPTESGTIEMVPVEGTSECAQTLKLNGGVIQMYSAICQTTINILTY
ncbi:MAG: hypothetical protein ACPGRX_03520 [Bdellovibrionales bacterium]